MSASLPVVIGVSKPYPRPIRFAFSASYHQVPGAPEAKRGLVAGRENWSQ